MLNSVFKSLDKEIIYGSKSFCHKSQSIIVKSRNGGFITQNCEACGKPRGIRQDELPEWFCRRCNSKCESIKNYDGNYAYKCPKCNTEIEVAAIVPHWNELFDKCGYNIDY